MGTHGGNGRHKSRGYQHSDAGDAGNHTHTGRFIQSDPVDKRSDQDEGNADAEILQSYGNAQLQQKAALFPMHAEVFPLEFKGKVLAAVQNHQRKQKTDRLRAYGGDGGTGGTHLQRADQNNVTDDVKDTGHDDQNHGSLGVAQAA